MKLEDVVKTGKRFKRPHMYMWMGIKGSLLHFFHEEQNWHSYATISTQDILADDWIYQSTVVEMEIPKSGRNIELSDELEGKSLKVRIEVIE